MVQSNSTFKELCNKLATSCEEIVKEHDTVGPQFEEGTAERNLIEDMRRLTREYREACRQRTTGMQDL